MRSLATVASKSSIRLFTLLAAFAALTVSNAHAQWQVVSLHPSSAGNSRAFGTRGGQQVGTVDSSAALWFGTSTSFVDLGPGVAVATDGQHQVGNAPSAVRWAGTAASRVALPLLYSGYATGIDNNVTCGYMPHQFAIYPAVWFDLSGGWLSTQPGVATSWMYGISANNGVGTNGIGHALLWPGLSVPGIVDLNPVGSNSSNALGVHGTSQVGWAMAPTRSAALWTGSAASFVNLAPAGSSQSEAHAVFGSRQVGYASFPGGTHAGIWNGTAASWIDLHALLPAGYVNSDATGVWIDAYGTTSVCGWGTLSTGQTRALFWYESAQPISFCAGDGSNTACPCGNVGDLGHGCGNSVDSTGSVLSASGSYSIANDQLTLTGTGLPDGPGLYYQGTTSPNNGAGVVFGDGLRCASGAIVRLGIVSATNHSSQYPRPGLDPSVSARGGVTANETRMYQLYYRDTGSFCTPSGYNTTNALRITWNP